MGKKAKMVTEILDMLQGEALLHSGHYVTVDPKTYATLVIEMEKLSKGSLVALKTIVRWSTYKNRG